MHLLRLQIDWTQRWPTKHSTWAITNMDERTTTEFMRNTLQSPVVYPKWKWERYKYKAWSFLLLLPSFSAQKNVLVGIWFHVRVLACPIVLIIATRALHRTGIPRNSTELTSTFVFHFPLCAQIVQSKTLLTQHTAAYSTSSSSILGSGNKFITLSCLTAVSSYIIKISQFRSPDEWTFDKCTLLHLQVQICIIYFHVCTDPLWYEGLKV